MSLFKYFGEQSSESHGGRLSWSSALGGLPFRGQAPTTLRQGELEQKVEISWEFHCKEFNLSKEEDRQQYKQIMDRAVNGWYYVHFVERYREEGIRFVYVEWSQRYGQAKPGNGRESFTDEDSSFANYPVDHGQRTNGR